MAALFTMNYCVIEHQHKAKAYINALRRKGYIPRRRTLKAEFLLIDHEWSGLFAGMPVQWRTQIIEAAKKKIPIFIYPHSVRPNIPHDLTDQYYPVNALFTIAEGHKEVLRRIGYPHPVEVVGWSYTDICPFRQRKPTDKISVLFAPIHPVSIYLPEDERELNAKAYKLLLGLNDKIDLTVRYIGALETNGLWEDSRVRFVMGNLDGQTNQMKEADVIIAGFTFAHMAVAMGNPLVMIGEGILPHNSPRNTGKLIYARNWNKYRDYMRYPHNVEDCKTPDDLLALIESAMAGSQDVERWKERFIGQPFDGRHFVERLESYL